jgi:hypothetical protein
LTIFVLLSVACAAPTADEDEVTGVGETAVPPTPANTMPESQAGGTYSALLPTLQATGATVAETGQLGQTFFGVPAYLIQVNGADLQVYEFADEQAQAQASDTISQAGYAIGTTQIEWIDQPHFWAQERLIVLYVGQDEETINMLTMLLGEPINVPNNTEGTPTAVTAAVNHLSLALNIAADDIEVVSFGRDEWPNGCLGLGEADEACTEALVPGWQILLNIADQQYEVRTNETGNLVRWQLARQ